MRAAKCKETGSNQKTTQILCSADEDDEKHNEEAKLSSIKLRETGNLLYKSRRFADAIASYSEAAVEAGKGGNSN